MINLFADGFLAWRSDILWQLAVVEWWHMQQESYSHSKIECFNSCPHAYRLQYVERRRPAFQTIEQHLGTTVHELLEFLYASRRGGWNPTASQALERFDELWQGPSLPRSLVVKPERSPEHYFHLGRQMVDDFYPRVFLEDRSETLGLEERFSHALEPWLIFNGVVDRLSRSENGALRVTDYKTGGDLPEAGSSPQLLAYALWAARQFQVDEVEVCYEDLRAETTHTAVVPASALPGFARDLRARIETVRTATEYPATPSKRCHWCGFQGRCQAFREHFQVESRPCPRCGSELELRSGRLGRFIGCTAFPRCRYSRDDW